MFDVGCLFGKEELEVTSIFGVFGLVLLDIMWQVEKFSIFNVKVCRAKDFSSVNGSSPDSANIFQYSMQVTSTAMVLAGSHCSSNSISFSCIFFSRIVPYFIRM